MRLPLHLIVGLLVAGCSTGKLEHDRFTFTAPLQFDGPITAHEDSDTSVHVFLRGRGDDASRIDIALVFVSSKQADSATLQSDSAVCADNALKGYLRKHSLLAKQQPVAVSAGPVPGTAIYYRVLRKGTEHDAVVACLRPQDFAVIIAFHEPSGVQPSDMPDVLRAIQSVTFK